MIGAFCLLVSALGPLAYGQRLDLPPGKWWKRPEVAERLALSRDQVNKIEAIWLDFKDRLIDLRAQVEKERTSLNALLESEFIDEPQALERLDRMLAARVELERSFFVMRLRIRSILTPEQRKGAERLAEESRKRPRREREQEQ